MNSFVFSNPKLCDGCSACTSACADAHKAVGMEAQPRVTIIRGEETNTPITCRHCGNAPCATVCPVNAITMKDNAIVLDEAACIGCRLCAVACPFGVITFPPSPPKGSAKKTEEAKSEVNPSLIGSVPAVDKMERIVALKCDLCGFSESGPECIKACMNGALFLVDDKALRRSSNAKRKLAAEKTPLVENFKK